MPPNQRLKSYDPFQCTESSACQVTPEGSLCLHGRLLFPQPLRVIGCIRPDSALLLQILVDVAHRYFTLRAGILTLCHLRHAFTVVGTNKHWLRNHRRALRKGRLRPDSSIPFVTRTLR
uniref:Uncharacterized protein n=1 Tax=Arundo donax TaxID=35708 RepID=A0A0A9GD02_ARUDO